jgi:hypothetical protein
MPVLVLEHVRDQAKANSGETCNYSPSVGCFCLPTGD